MDYTTLPLSRLPVGESYRHPSAIALGLDEVHVKLDSAHYCRAGSDEAFPVSDTEAPVVRLADCLVPPAPMPRRRRRP